MSSGVNKTGQSFIFSFLPPECNVKLGVGYTTKVERN